MSGAPTDPSRDARRCHVTGANGFVGSNVVRALLDRGWQVVALVGRDYDLTNLEGLPVERREIDLLDAGGLRAALRDGTHLVHTAAAYSFWAFDREGLYRTNVLGTRNVLAAAQALGLEKVVYTSTQATLTPGFGVEGKLGDERNAIDLRRFGGDYKTSKIMAEIEALRAAARGLPLVIVYPTVVLGPGDRRPTPTGEMIVHYLRGHMKVFIDMPQNLAHVTDVAAGHVLALERGRPGERYLLGGDDLSMREIVGLLDEITGIPAPRHALPLRLLRVLGAANDWLSRRVTRRPPLFPLEAALHARDGRAFSCAKAIEELGYAPRPARAVLEDAVRWFLSQGHASDAQRQRIESHMAAREDAATG